MSLRPAPARHRLALMTALAAAFVVVAAGCAGGSSGEAAPTTSPSPTAALGGAPSTAPTTPATTPAPSPTGESPALPAGWTLCQNPTRGSSMGYPGGWYTTSLRPAEKCSQFDPAAFTIPEAGEYPITANPMLEDVFANLIANAIKYAAEGRRLEIDVVDEPTCWVVRVRDFGKGIPDRDKPMVFTRFTRLKKEGVEGSGLGLAIVKRLVDLHKGSIWIEDNPGGGAVFCVRLPKDGPQSVACANP